MKNILLLLLGAVISIGAVMVVFSQVDFDAFQENIRHANGRYIIFMTGLYFVAMLIRGARWRLMVADPIDFWRGVHIVNISYLFNTILPLRMGEAARVIMMTREPRQSVGSSVSALALERLADLCYALGAVGLGLLLIPHDANLPESTANTLGFLVIAAVFGVFLVLFLPRTHPIIIAITRFVTRPLPTNLADKLSEFVEDTLTGFRAIANPGRLALVLLVTLLLWATYLGYYMGGLLAFSPDVPLEVGLLVMGFVAVGAATPSLPGAVGVFQAAAVLALNLAGYDTSLATGVAWVVWVIQILLILLTGMFSLWAMGLSFQRLSHDVQHAEL